MGAALAGAFSSKDLSGLVTPSTSPDAAAARQRVEVDQTAATVIFPAGLTASIIPDIVTGQSGPAGWFRTAAATLPAARRAPRSGGGRAPP